MAEARPTAKSRKSAPVSPSAVSGPAQAKAIHEYQNALQQMQQGKYEKAATLFEKIIAAGPAELQERSRVYLTVCQRHGSRDALTFSTLEEHYDYAISQLNTGYYEEAREHLEAILVENPSADYALYGLAVLESMTGRAEECLEQLQRAITVNPQNRIQARTDSDFQDMLDDPRFTELLYPE